MQTEVKKTNMTLNIAEIAKEFELAPGVVYGVLNDLGIEHDGSSFEADDDTVELVREGALQQAGSKVLVLKPQPTPRDMAVAMGVGQAEVQKALLQKLKTMAAATTSLKPDIAEKLADAFGFTMRIGEPPAAKPAANTNGQARKGGAQTRPP